MFVYVYLAVGNLLTCRPGLLVCCGVVIMLINGMLTVINIYAYLYILLVFNLRRISANVVFLTDANFTDKIGTYEVALIKFHAPR